MYVLAAIVKKRLRLNANLNTILKILSATLSENALISQLLTDAEARANDLNLDNKLNLFQLITGHYWSSYQKQSFLLTI